MAFVTFFENLRESTFSICSKEYKPSKRDPIAELKITKISNMTGTPWILPKCMKSVMTYGALGKNNNHRTKLTINSGLKIFCLVVFTSNTELMKK